MAPLSIEKEWTDYRALQRLEQRAAERYREAGYDPSDWSTAHAEDFARHAANGLLWVAVCQGTAMGFAVADLFRDALHLEELDVDPPYQRRGIGLALVRQVVDEARGRLLTSVTLRTFLSTPWSMGLYLKAGFRRLEADEQPYYLVPHLRREREMGLPMADRCTLSLDPTTDLFGRVDA